MSKSIVSNKRECLICGIPFGLHRHHIFSGSANRKKSEEYGCWCYLCGYHHNGSNNSVHHNNQLNLQVKKWTQKKFQEHYPEQDFIKVFGKSYL